MSLVKGDDLVLNPIPSFPDCTTIDIIENFSKLYAPKQIFIKLKKTDDKNLGVNLYILDRQSASRRSLKSQFLAYSGPPLANTRLKNVKKEVYILKITQTKDTDEDQSTGCQNYPNEKYESYSDCDAEFVHEQMLGEGVMPFWATDDMDEVTVFR